MSKDPKDALEALAGGDIPIFTVGDMRLLNLKIPKQLADAADDDVMVAPRAVAENMFSKALVRWRIPEEEAADFTLTAGAIEIMRVLQIHHYLRLVFPNTKPDSFVWLHTQNSAFEDAGSGAVYRACSPGFQALLHRSVLHGTAHRRNPRAEVEACGF